MKTDFYYSTGDSYTIQFWEISDAVPEVSNETQALEVWFRLREGELSCAYHSCCAVLTAVHVGAAVTLGAQSSHWEEFQRL